MNYLGHLYLSGDNPEIMLANIFGDFVKGKDYSHLPQFIQKGVSLHRNIDDYVDHHPIVSELRLELYAELPKIAGIAIDLYFDHLLAENWRFFHQKPLQEYVASFFDFTFNQLKEVPQKHNFHFPPEFIHLIQIMHRQNWIMQYKEIDGLIMASMGLSKRISFPNNLHEASDVFLKHQQEIKDTFLEFMEDAKVKFDIHTK